MIMRALFFSKRIKSKLILESNDFVVEMGGGVVYLIRNFNNKETIKAHFFSFLIFDNK